jgi:hypothetical protein
MSRPRVRRFVLVALLALVAGGVAAVSARADAPDVKVSSPAPGQHPFQTGTATVDTATGHVTVTLTGGWSWPTHGADCNTNRAGAGVAVNWFDPSDRGFHVTYFNLSGGIPNTTPGGPDDFGVGATGANGLNPADDVVHPTENDTGTGAVADITDPSNFANWRGGCGVFSSDTVLVNTGGVLSYTTATVAHGNFGQATAGSTDRSGTPFNDPTPPSSASLQGALLSHVYASKADVTQACALMYDVHSGTTAAANNGAGIPGAQQNVTAGQQAVATGAKYSGSYNTDNSIQSNGGTPAGNSCPTFSFPSNFPTIATKLSASTVEVGSAVHDSATLTGATANAGGTVTYSVYSDNSCKTKVADGGTVNVTNASVPDSNAVTFSTVGTYYWQAAYSGDSNNNGSLSTCTDEQLVVNQITPPPPQTFCVAISGISPNQLFVGRKTTLTIHVSRHGKALAGIKVRIKGKKLNTVTKSSNHKGVIRKTVKLKKAGVLVFTPLASKRCGTKRIGVTGVFTPPVTG